MSGSRRSKAICTEAERSLPFFCPVSSRETRAGRLTPNPSELGLTQNDWLGRSQFVLDSYLKGTIDDFRIYDGALSDAATFALAHPGN